jgi:molybdopterin molybdotransferase
MISLNEARKIIDASVNKRPGIAVSLPDALGCALDEDVIAPIDVPQFPSSRMDGIALRFSDLKGDGPWRLPLQRTIAAGEMTSDSLLPVHAVKIMTGAPLIDGADTIVPLEEVTFEGEQALLHQRPSKKSSVRPRGDDIVAGQRLLDGGAVLEPISIGALASLGMTSARVIPRPRITVFSTGSEIIEPGEKLSPGKIYDSNDGLLRTLLAMDGHRTAGHRVAIKDEPSAILISLRECLRSEDLVITTGAVSIGDFDFIPEAVFQMGGKVIFHRVSIKPGKPTLLARVNGLWILGLPGNPVGVLVGYHLFARRIIARLMGINWAPRSASATLACDLDIDSDRLCIIGARLEETPDGIIAHPATRQESNRLSSVIGTDGFIFVDGGTRAVSKNTKVHAEWL